MIINPQVSLHRVVLSLSQALDCAEPQIDHHQQRVAYIALQVARRLGIDDSGLRDLFLAASLHDIGLIRSADRARLFDLDALEHIAWHGEAGWRLLKDNSLLAGSADIVRWHHRPWSRGRGRECRGAAVPLLSHVVHLADAVERGIDRRTFILDQSRAIIDRLAARAGDVYHPDAVIALQDAAQTPAFWLDIVSSRVYSILLHQTDWPVLVLDERGVGLVAETFARVVDARSRWTARHSAGVAASAVALAQRLSFAPRELALMRAAGYLHDLGKLCVPTEVLEKPGELDPHEWHLIRAHTYHTFHILNTIGGLPRICEWAAFHHERPDGRGYPFHHAAPALVLGARIMAVADVFTAVTEDRPYRPGLPREKALPLLEHLVESGGLDGHVVATLREHFDAINEARDREETAYAARQADLVLEAEMASAAGRGA